MAWESLSSRFSSLPLVLAGPIVRKTTRTSVSIWIALKEAQSLELVIKPAGQPDISGSTNTKAFGKNLHIALITVTGLTLQPNTIYHYDIKFSGSRTLSTQGILESNGGISKITYTGESLPSFMLPSDDMLKLKILHSSCRKPHGGVTGLMGKDLLEGASSLLGGTINDVGKRPQQLYLTGDQIYADDVSDLLLFMLRDAEDKLLDWGSGKERLPSNPIQQELAPMHRLPLVTAAKFTSGDVGNSHLLQLGEFYSMYLFVWSDVLWPEVTEFPSYQDYESYFVDDPDFALSDETKQAMYDSRFRVLSDFRYSLRHVRRLFANISTYMIFDDHEITDDWFLNRPWTESVFNSVDGKRIIQNGLSAYAVFQGWGNKPEIFSDSLSKEYSLLNALITLNQDGTSGVYQAPHWSDIGSIVNPTITDVSASGCNLSGGIDWSYSLSFDEFNVIVLNTRTNRALFKNYSGLMSNSAIETQIRDRLPEKLPQHDFTLIVAPAPVFGLPLMEDLIQPIVAKLSGASEGDYESWSADRNKFEHFLSEVSAYRRILFLSGDVHYAFSNSVDYWNKRTGTELISKIVNLTSSSLKNSAGMTTSLADIINNHIHEILFNMENDGLYLGWNTANSPGSEYILTEYTQMEKDNFGVVDPNYTTTTQGRISVNRGGGAGVAHWHRLARYDYRNTPRRKTEIRHWVDPRFPPDWEYQIVFESDFRNESDRMMGTMPTLSASAGTIGTAANHSTLAKPRGNHTLIGDNNMGEITFQWGNSENDRKVVHRIWSNVKATIIPLTMHLVDFGIAAATDQKPSEKGKKP